MKKAYKQLQPVMFKAVAWLVLLSFKLTSPGAYAYDNLRSVRSQEAGPSQLLDSLGRDSVDEERSKAYIIEQINHLRGKDKAARERAAVILEEYYRPNIIRYAEELYYVARYYCEVVAGIPFTEYEADDFIAQANFALLEFLENFYKSERAHTGLVDQALAGDWYYYRGQVHSYFYYNHVRDHVLYSIAEMVGESLSILPANKRKDAIHGSLASYLRNIVMLLRNPPGSINAQRLTAEQVKEALTEKSLEVAASMPEHNPVAASEYGLVLTPEFLEGISDPVGIVMDKDLSDLVYRILNNLPLTQDEEITDFEQNIAEALMGKRAHSIADLAHKMNLTAEEVRDAWISYKRKSVNVSLLDSRERGILIRRYGLFGNDPETLEEIKDLYEITRERVRKISLDALAKIRRRLLSLAGTTAFDEYRKFGGLSHEDGAPTLDRDYLNPSLEGLSRPSEDIEEHGPLTAEEKEEFITWVRERLNNSQLQVLPYVLQGRTDDYIRTVLKRDKIYYTDERVATIRKTLLAELRIWFTLDMLERFGTYGEVRQNLVALFSKPVSSRMVIGPAPEAQVIESQVHEDISLAV